MVAAMTPEILRAQAERDVLDKRLQHMKVEAAANAEADARELAVELAGFEVPAIPQLLAGDATPEAVAGLLQNKVGGWPSSAPKAAYLT